MSRTWKTGNTPIDVNEILEGIMALPVERWRYTFPQRDQHGEHIGTYAEDFSQTFGIGDGATINYLDAIGVCMAAIQALAGRIKELEHVK